MSGFDEPPVQNLQNELRCCHQKQTSNKNVKEPFSYLTCNIQEISSPEEELQGFTFSPHQFINIIIFHHEFTLKQSSAYSSRHRFQSI